MQRRMMIVFALVLLLGCTSSQTLLPSESPDPSPQEIEVIVSITDEPIASLLPTEPPAQSAAPTDTPVPTETPIPTDTEKSYVAKDGVYTIAWISDPQHYSKKFPETYYAMTGFLAEHREEMHLAYIINTGDLVHNTDQNSEWTVADRAQSMIDDIPNGVLAGNHDVLEPIGYKTFSELFGEKRYRDRPWYGGSFENNRGHFDLITIGETDYLFVYMGFAPTKKAIQWVYDIFREYPDRVGILCLHDYYTKTLELSEDGKKWHDRVVVNTPNLYIVLCGHKYGAYCIKETLDDNKDGKEDRTVYQMMFNYQASLRDGGGGYLRLMQIDEAHGTLYTMTYSPLLDDFNRFDDPNNREKNYPFNEQNEEFVLPLPWIQKTVESN